MTEFRLPDPQQNPRDILDASKLVAEQYFNDSEVHDQLWSVPNDLPSITSEALGAYALGQTPEHEVLDWSERYTADRARLMPALASYIEHALDTADTFGVRIADIVSSQYVLPEPVIKGEDLVELADQIA